MTVPDKPSSRAGKATMVSSTLFAEGLPWSVLHQVIPECFTALGLPPKVVGYTSYLHATISLKVVWSPIVELFGTLRTWMVATQAAMGVGIGILALLAANLGEGSTASLAAVWTVLVIVGVLSATHDIACDGYYMQVLDDRDQARYSGWRVAAYRGAMLVGSSGLVVMGGRIGWMAAFAAASAIMIVLAGWHLSTLPRPRTDSATDGGRSSRAGRFRDSYASFLDQDRIVVVVAFLVFYKLADVMMMSMSPVLLARELGVPTEIRGFFHAVSMGSGIAGAFAGGIWIARASLERAFLPITLAMALTEPLYVALAAWAPELRIDPGVPLDRVMAEHLASILAVGGVIVIEQVCAGMSLVAHQLVIMRRCHPDHRAAHFAFATAVYSVAHMAVGGQSGAIYEGLGPIGYYWFVSALTIPAILVAVALPTRART